MNVEITIYRNNSNSGWFTITSTENAIDFVSAWKLHNPDDTIIEIVGNSLKGELETLSICANQIAGISTEALQEATA